MDHNLLNNIAAVAGIVSAVAAIAGLALTIFLRRRAKPRRTSQEILVESSSHQVASSNQTNISNLPQITNAPQFNIQIAPHLGHLPEMSTSAAPTAKIDKVHQEPASNGVATKTLPKPPKVKTIEDERYEAAKDLVRALSDTVKYAYDTAEQYEKAMRDREEGRFGARLSALLALAKALYLERSNSRAPVLIAAIRDVYSGVTRLELHIDGEDPPDVMLGYVDPFAASPRERTPQDMPQVFTAQVERIIDALEQENFVVQRNKVPYKSYRSYSLGPRSSQP